MREGLARGTRAPDFAALHPGYPATLVIRKRRIKRLRGFRKNPVLVRLR
jgi:hypothetical protein